MNLLTPHSLSQTQKDIITQKITGYFSRKNEIIAVVLFGSFPEGTFRDVDIGLVFDMSFHPPRYYEQRIERELTHLIYYPVDVRILNTAPVRFVYQVLKKQNVIYCSNLNAFSSFESRILREYFDYAYYLNRYRRELIGII